MFQANPGLTVLQIEKELRSKIEYLKKEKQERLKILKTLKEEEQGLCDALCMTPYYIQSNTTPSGEQLEILRQHITKLTAEKVRLTFTHKVILPCCLRGKQRAKPYQIQN